MHPDVLEFWTETKDISDTTKRMLGSVNLVNLTSTKLLQASDNRVSCFIVVEDMYIVGTHVRLNCDRLNFGCKII